MQVLKRHLVSDIGPKMGQSEIRTGVGGGAMIVGAVHIIC